VLYVVGSTTLIAGDAAVKSRLEGLGFTVVVKDAPSSATADATGKVLVVISESVTATDVGIKFRDVAVPVLTLEAGLFDDMQMTGPTVGTDYDNATGQTQVVIADSSHPMSAGLSGTVTVTTSATAFAWGRPGAGAVKAATLGTDATKYALFGYETGASMFNGMSAPARRAGVFLWKDTPTFRTPAAGRCSTRPSVGSRRYRSWPRSLTRRRTRSHSTGRTLTSMRLTAVRSTSRPHHRRGMVQA
jgi:hypothetical protein